MQAVKLTWHGFDARWVLLIAIVASALPLLWLPFAPLPDAPGHIGQFRVIAEAGRGPLAEHYRCIGR